ncbi:MAG: SPOR domain-containing protein [Azoarcus sp.]|jgi:cell division septation protein DedD|nr:SPOR domain-containing protein [Azoarcus sp.]
MMRKFAAAADLRRKALLRAGFAITLATALLIATLWYEYGGEPAALVVSRPAPPPEVSYPIYAIDAASGEAIVPVDEIIANAVENASIPPASEAAAPEQETAPQATAPESEPPTAGAVGAVAEPPLPSEPPPPSLQSGYFIQLGVFDSMDNAKSLLDNVLASGLPAHTQARVVVGPFRNKSEAEAARRRLKSIAEGIVLPPLKTGKATAKAASKPKRRAAK